MDFIENNDNQIIEKIDEKKLNEIKEKINKFEKELNTLNQIIERLKYIIEEKRKKINEERKSIQEFKKLLNYNSSINKKLINDINLKEKIIDEIKLNIPKETEEKKISIILNTFDQNICCSIICKSTDNFSIIENIFYDKYPDYKMNDNFFIVNGKIIDKMKNLDENNIGDGNIITIKSIN